MVSILSNFFYYQIHFYPKSCFFLAFVFDPKPCITLSGCLRSIVLYYSFSMSSIAFRVLFFVIVFDLFGCIIPIMCLRSNYLFLSLSFFLRSCLSLFLSRSSSSVPKRSISGFPTRHSRFGGSMKWRCTPPVNFVENTYWQGAFSP
jgi:hypothetical protein